MDCYDAQVQKLNKLTDEFGEHLLAHLTGFLQNMVCLFIFIRLFIYLFISRKN
jgi:hypothetical protein